ncbi:MAG: synthase subunit [Nocardioides sp.]|nr:synthase subunit [Nocardioides sp.]
MMGLLTLVASEAAPEKGSTIEIGHHVERTWLGMTFNVDTIWATLVAGTIVILLGFWAKAKITQGDPDQVPTKIQLVWEAVVGEVTKQVEDNLGKVNPFVVPLAVALFFFILIANWFELVPSQLNDQTGHLLPAPTADTNLTYALAAITIVGVWTFGIRSKGVKGYFKHFLEPFPVLLPLNILEELVKPITLALRLFGNIFAGGIMLALIGMIPIWGAWAPNVLWKLFDMFIGGIQAFIFALLTVLYFGMAGAQHGDEHEEHAEDEAKTPALAG